MKKLIVFLSLLLFLCSCEKEVSSSASISGTKWYRCDVEYVWTLAFDDTYVSSLNGYYDKVVSTSTYSIKGNIITFQPAVEGWGYSNKPMQFEKGYFDEYKTTLILENEYYKAEFKRVVQ